MDLWLEFDLLNDQLHKEFLVSRELCILMVGLDMHDIGNLIGQLQTVLEINLSEIDFWESSFREEFQPIERLYRLFDTFWQRLENKDLESKIDYKYVSKEFLKSGLRGEILELMEKLGAAQSGGASKVKFVLEL